MSEENKALVRRWFEEVWNKGRAEAIDEMFAEDGVAHGLSDAAGQPLRGPAGFRPFFRSFRDAFPDTEVTVEDVIAEGDKLAARCSVRAKHQGDTLGFTATGRPIEITGMTFLRVRDGKIIEAWNNFDFMTMFQQLGALQLSAPAAADDAKDYGRAEGDA
ncbi:MAG TPA: ester cyclase [Pyrinomonadaceae bacterium]|nr:ester cyclase [Pyrinomonadaceae bacterium]